MTVNTTTNNTTTTENKGVNTMITTTEFKTTKAGLNRINVVEVTDSLFMNRMTKDYGTSIQKDENKGVGQITIASNVSSAVALLDDEQFKTLAFKALETVLGDRPGFNSGSGEYLGLFVEEITADRVEMDYVTVSAKQEEFILTEMINCDLNDIKNLRKIFADINDLFRMYQELTIDAAKKLYVICATFYNETLKANSTVKLDHDFYSFKDFRGFSINRTNKYVAPKDMEIGEAVEFRNDKGEIVKIAFKDKISVIQDAVAEQFAHLVNTDIIEAYNNITVSDEVEASFAIGSEFSAFAADMYESIRKPYSKLTAWKAEEIAKANEALANKYVTPFAANQRIDEINAMYDRKISGLSNLARFLTKDMDMSLAGRLMFMISNIKREKQNWVVDKESTNQLFLTVAPELFLAYIVENHAEIKVCGYKVLGETSDLVEGQKLTFLNGNAVEVSNVYVDSDFSGELTVQTVDGVLSVVKPIEIPRIEAVEPKTFAVSVWENSVINALHFAKTKESVRTANFDTLKTQHVFEKAEKIQLVPFYQYKNSTGKTKYVYNAIVVTIPSLNDPSIKFEIPVAQYLCNSATFERMIAGLTVSEVLTPSIDGKTMRISFSYGEFEEVGLNHSREEVGNTEVKDINNDPFDSSVKVSDKAFATDVEDPFAEVAATVTATKIEDEAFGVGTAETTFEGFDDEDAVNGLSSDDFAGCDFSIFG